jgi:hypothetical protein
MANFHIEGRAKFFPDIQRSYNWELFVPYLPILPGTPLTSEDLTVACKSVQIPERTLDTYKSYFYGQAQVWPITNSFSNEFTVTLEEREDQKVFTTFTNWMQSICSSEPKNPLTGTSGYITKKQYAVSVWLKMYKYNGDAMPFAIRYHNCFPTKIDSVNLDYNSNEAVKFNVTMSYDYYSVSSDGINL